MSLLLLIVAAVLFLCAAFGLTAEVNLLALGLFCWVLSGLVGYLPKRNKTKGTSV